MTDPIDLSISQFSGAWRLMCASGRNAAIRSDGGMELIFSGVPVPFFNVGLVTGRGVSSEALESLGADACAFAADQGMPWLFVVTSEALQPGTDAAAVLDRCGLAPMMGMTGMMAQQISPGRPIPEGLELRVPQNEADCAALLDVNGAAYNMDLEAGKALLGPAFWQGRAPVLGLVGGSPVSCAAVWMVDGYRYVALVATEPSHQRRGYAEAAMRRALDVSAQAHGERPTVLHASDAGRPIYERMGYAAISSHTIFVEKKFLEGH
jgi:GNAT superfamily N-acetyltransferase